MNYDAKIVVHIFTPPEDAHDLLGCQLFGWVFEDTKQGGNHPFRDGQYVNTTTVQSVLKEKDAVYLMTKNTTYLCVGFAKDGSDLAPKTNILGDPVE